MMILEKLKRGICQLLIQKIDNHFGLEYSEFNITKSQKEGYGDFTSTVAFSLSKQLRKPPMEIAEKLEEEEVVMEPLRLRIEAVTPGFINIYLQKNWKLVVLEELQRRGLARKSFSGTLKNYEVDYSNIRREINYIIFRTEWILEVFEKEGIHPNVGLSQVDYSPSPMERKLIDKLVEAWDLLEQEDIDEMRFQRFLQDMVETFWKHHNSISLRKLEEGHRSFVLGLFLVINKILKNTSF